MGIKSFRKCKSPLICLTIKVGFDIVKFIKTNTHMSQLIILQSALLPAPLVPDTSVHSSLPSSFSQMQQTFSSCLPGIGLDSFSSM